MNGDVSQILPNQISTLDVKNSNKNLDLLITIAIVSLYLVVSLSEIGLIKIDKYNNINKYSIFILVFLIGSTSAFASSACNDFSVFNISYTSLDIERPKPTIYHSLDGKNITVSPTYYGITLILNKLQGINALNFAEKRMNCTVDIYEKNVLINTTSVSSIFPEILFGEPPKRAVFIIKDDLVGSGSLNNTLESGSFHIELHPK